MGAGARSMGMGSLLRHFRRCERPYWNPAAMTQMERKELQAMHVALYEQTAFDHVSLVYPRPGRHLGLE